MSIIWQDLIVTVVSLAAAGTLFQRVFGLVASKREKPQCGACNSCAVQQAARPHAANRS